jgi:hypothetical protein
MSLFTYTCKRRSINNIVCAVILAMVLSAFTCDRSYAEKPKQGTFSSPQEAVTVMVAAMKSGNNARLLAVFGGAAKELFFFDDDTMDRFMGEEFLRAYEENNRLEPLGKKKVILHVGQDDWAWPIPVIKAGQRWRFDTKEGRREILARRIGENELAAIQVCLAYVDAQREYAQNHRTNGIMEYAQKLLSDPGKKDGLCWEDREDGKQSPLGPLVGNACKATHAGAAPQISMMQPYHGYFYRILNKQGKNAPGGAYDYVVDGRMIGGFALVAYPARYGFSGVMTLIVNHNGVVYEKDLGKNTNQIAEALAGFDPDQTWKKVQ